MLCFYLFIAIALPLALPAHHHQGKSLPTTRHMLVVHVMIVFLQLSPSPWPSWRRIPRSAISSTASARWLSWTTGSLRISWAVSVSIYILSCIHIYWIYSKRRCSVSSWVYSFDDEFCCLTLVFTEGPPPPPPSHVQNYGPQGTNNYFQYSQCTGKKKALCVCFFFK